MCRFVLLCCVNCRSVRRPKLLEGKNIETATANVFEETSCGYWYCDALRDELSPLRRSHETCGDQFCELDRCKASPVMWNCCSGDSPIFYRRYVVESKEVRELRIEPYLIPVLTNRHLLLLLLDHFHDSDSQIATTCYDDKLIVVVDDYKLYFSTYYVYVKGSTYDSSRVRYQVRVERFEEKADPQIYDGLLSKFLTLRALHRRAGTFRSGEREQATERLDSR